MKPDSPLPKLPSLSELLKHPTLERIVDQVNQTTIAQRATGFLEEIRASLPQPSVQGFVPSIHQLAERLARRLLDPSEHIASAIYLGRPMALAASGRVGRSRNVATC